MTEHVFARVEPLARGLSIIGGFNCDHREKSLQQIARETSATMVTTSRTLKTLVQGRYLVKDESTKRYSLGPAVLAWAYVYEQHAELSEVARPYLERVSSLTGESVILAAEIEGVAVAVARVVGSLPLKTHLPPGCFHALETSGIRKIFAAHRGPGDRRKLGRRQGTQETDPSNESLKREFREVRKTNLAFGVEGSNPDVWSVAVPLKIDPREVVACVAVVMPQGRFLSEQRGTVIDALKRETESLSERLKFLAEERNGLESE